MAATETWTDLHRCPFCGEYIPSPGKGFMIHISEAAECDADFEMWREHVAEDIQGGWTG